MAQATNGSGPAPTEEELSRARLRLVVRGPVAHVTISRPDRRNAMTGRTWTTLARIGQTLPEDVRIVVIDGDGDIFSAGIDLGMFSPEGVDGERSMVAGLADGTASDAEVRDYIAGLQEGFLWLRRPDLVTVAAVRGHAIGAGFQLALSCDLRILADDAQLCMKEPALGLVPDLTGTKPLVDIVGVNRAIEICLTARRVGAQEARDLGLAELVVPADELSAAVDDVVAALLATDRAAATATKALLQQAAGNTLQRQAEAERAAQAARLAALARASVDGSR
ncbi:MULTISPECIES: enoyl-CoA hydratase/isomerase family protein [Nocardiopsis]|uniref:Enoyl-CoA hydratase/isomerase n=1 Tax=Nocardiopsis dassonvillei (strain ATCC 23218 / DSM 43111 / CIP 107115 / JCM 7437 / KCTC 9190 / NBRC 14626 / NCTC 10488 / NRRL B-5397 / IMRU 509) TaxID=446468 RepID=D7AZU1_NOCDD|nr:enoyl-CoA hydratase/isomerase family protein [Nocardiopsis dassonvillei]ADH68212.1 Enoyl-CoA hydratase/isomerase [Nocardiopsis dassonvillei subsp. dassonvillei DSM 43111]NKY78305.1 enoyl-CoA hydratase/isomerase family protein [Nocardiopsis dassonvillei]VEI88715.1 Probable enoyl-CoA hydratase echA8 [Nocardiopsis dassonvillei]